MLHDAKGEKVSIAHFVSMLLVDCHKEERANGPWKKKRAL